MKQKENEGGEQEDKVPHLCPIKSKEEAQTSICNKAFIRSFKRPEITESKMLIKWRQEMGSVGLLLSRFSRDRGSHSPHALPPGPFSVLLTYKDHNPLLPNINWKTPPVLTDGAHKSAGIQKHLDAFTLWFLFFKNSTRI